MSWLPDSVRWYATVLVIGLAFAPFARWIGNRLPDKGASLALPLGLLAMIWPTWYLASISPFPFSTVGLWLTVAIGTAVGWFFAVRRGWITRDWLIALATVQAVLLIAFVAYIGLRGYTPRITGTEKPMDIAFLSSSARATDMPPHDPWFTGESINYYYLGYFVHGSLARMSGVPTWVAFNLALATTVAMTLVGAAGVAFNVGRAWFSRRGALTVAALGAFLIAIAGNMRAPIRFLQDPSATIHADWWGRIGWQSSRIVIDHGSPQAETINEFPWFSFLLGDLHPHVTSLPFTLLALGLAVSFLVSGWREQETSTESWFKIVVAGIAIGALYPLNSWDFPTYLVIAIAALVFATGWNRAAAERCGVLIAAAVLSWLPFTVSFVPFAGGDTQDLPSSLRDVPLLSRLLTTVGFYSGERTNIGEFMTVFGVAWLAAVAYLTLELVGAGKRGELPRVSGWAIALAIIVGLTAILASAPVILLAGGPLVAALSLMWLGRDRESDPRRVVGGLLAAGFGLILLTEFFYIQDVFSGRFNTLFKVYYQVWTLFGIGAALAIGLMWRKAATVVGSIAPRAALAGAVAVAIAACSVYPILASDQWTDWAGPRDWQGLDGAAFIGQTSQGDLAAIHWLSDHAKKDDVVLEAPGCQYRINFGEPTSRLSAFTGVPTIIGWDGSEGQWRDGQSSLKNEIIPRADDVKAMYANPQSPLFDQYRVTLLYVGHFERDGAGGECEKAGPYAAVGQTHYPGAGWTEVFSSDDGELYRRTG